MALLTRTLSGLLRGALALTFVLALVGCAQTEKDVKADPFFDKWKTMSETSKATSPVARVREMDDASEQVLEPAKPPTLLSEAGQDLAPERPLPTQPVTMRMKDSPVGVVLRAISRGVGQNLLINSGVDGLVSVDVKKVPWNEVFLSILNSQGLRYTWEGDIIRIQTAEDMEKDLAVRQVQERTQRQKLVAQSVEPLIMKVVKIDYADPEELVGPVSAIIADVPGKTGSGKETDKETAFSRGSVQLDAHSNSLILLAVRADINKMLALIDELDKPPYQVHIQANIVETTRQTARDLGVQWGWMYGRYDSLGNDTDLWITPGGTAGSTATRGAPLTGGYTSASGAKGVGGQGNGINFPADLSNGAGAALGLMVGKVGSNILEVQLSALAQANKINILSSPSITTLDNQLAFTENGTKVPYVTINSDGDREVKFEDATLKLEITPHVIDPKQLKMEVEIQKDEVDEVRNVDGNPYIYKKKTKTTLIVRNGETVVISGLSKAQNSGGEKGVPWVKDIPGLGWLFKGESNNDTMEEVLVFLTPNVLPQFTGRARQPDSQPPSAPAPAGEQP